MTGSAGGVLKRRDTVRLTGAGLALIAVCYGLARFAYGLFLPVLRDTFALDSATAGAIAAGSFAAYCVAILGSMVATPRFGARAVAVAAGVIATGGILLVAVAPTAAVLTVGVLVAGASTGVASPPLVHAVAHTVTHPMRNRTQTVINSGTGAGVSVAGPIALLSGDHWRAAWLVFAGISVLVTLAVAHAVPTGPVARRSGPAALSSGPLLSGPLLLPRPLLPAGSVRLIVAATAMGAASAAVWTFGRDLLVTVGGMSQAASVGAWILLGICGAGGAVAGDLAGRFGLANAWTATMLLLGLATALMAAFPGSAVVAWAAAGAFGAGYIALAGLTLVWGTEVYPAAPAAGVGLAFLVQALGQATSAPVVGALSDAAGPLPAFAVAALVAVAGGMVRPHRA